MGYPGENYGSREAKRVKTSPVMKQNKKCGMFSRQVFYLIDPERA